MKKTETLEEFRARGGKIQRLPYVPPEKREDTNVRKTTHGPATTHHITEGELLFGESTTRNRVNHIDSKDELDRFLEAAKGDNSDNFKKMIKDSNKSKDKDVK